MLRNGNEYSDLIGNGIPAFLDRTGRALRLGNCQTFFSKSEDGEHLLAIHARKPVEKLIDCHPGFQILKKGFYRYPRVLESPGAAQGVCGTLHRWACSPIHHAMKLNARRRSVTAAIGSYSRPLERISPSETAPSNSLNPHKRALFNRKLIESDRKLTKMAHPRPSTHIQFSTPVRDEFIARCRQ